MAKGETCSVCGKEPVLYFSNGRVFCKAHKAEATQRAQRGLNNYRAEKAVEHALLGEGGTLVVPQGGHGNTKPYFKFGGAKRKP